MECMDPKCRCIFQSIAETTKVFAPSMLPKSQQHPQMLTLRKGKNAREKAESVTKPHFTERPPRRAKPKEIIPVPLDLAGALLECTDPQ